MKELPSIVLCASLFATALDAQQEWFVDEGQLVQPVIDAAAPGDRVVIRGMHYQEPGLQVSKSLEIVGEGGQATVSSVNVTGLPRRAQVTFRDLTMLGRSTIRACAGTVSFVDAELGAGWHPFYFGGLSAEGARRVHLERCSLVYSRSGYGAIDAVELRGSQLTLVDSVVYGGGMREGDYIATTVRLRDRSRIVAYGSEIHGPTGHPGGFSTSCYCVLSPGSGKPAIVGDAGVFIAGSSTILGGRDGDSSDPSRPFPIEVPGARVSDDSQLIGRDYPGIRRIANQPGLFLDGDAQLGGSITATVDGDPGDLTAVLVDLRAHDPRFFDGTDMPVWVTTQAWVGGVGVIPAGGEAPFAVVIPNEPPLRFSGLWMQAVTLAPGAMALGVSNLRLLPIE